MEKLCSEFLATFTQKVSKIQKGTNFQTVTVIVHNLSPSLSPSPSPFLSPSLSLALPLSLPLLLPLPLPLSFSISPSLSLIICNQLQCCSNWHWSFRKMQRKLKGPDVLGQDIRHTSMMYAHVLYKRHDVYQHVSLSLSLSVFSFSLCALSQVSWLES